MGCVAMEVAKQHNTESSQIKLVTDDLSDYGTMIQGNVNAMAVGVGKQVVRYERFQLTGR